MDAVTTRVREMAREVIGNAQGRLQDIEGNARRVLVSVTGRVFDGPAGEGVPEAGDDTRNRNRFEELVGSWKVSELLDKLRADDVLAYGVSLRRELSERLGFALEADMAALGDQLAALRKDVEAMQRRVSGRGRDSLGGLQKQLRELKAEIGRLKRPVPGSREEASS